MSNYTNYFFLKQDLYLKKKTFIMFLLLLGEPEQNKSTYASGLSFNQILPKTILQTVI